MRVCAPFVMAGLVPTIHTREENGRICATSASYRVAARHKAAHDESARI
jgi:hypothetical protein